jgi:choline dehydrogenase-like flavoprotein
MEIDLEQHDATAETFRSRVCILGAGIAGLTIAQRLGLIGIDVALLEAGGRNEDSEKPGLIAKAKLAGTPHLGTLEGRFRTFGGCSVRWGGQVLPLPPLRYVPSAVPHAVHLEAGPCYLTEEAWPLKPDALTPFYCVAEHLLDVDALPFDASTFFAARRAQSPPLLRQLEGLDSRLSKWTAFDHRNFNGTFGKEVLASRTTTVYLHAQATELVLSAARDRIEAVLVRTAAGRTFRFEAEHFIVATGTVETSRLLLASRSVAPEGVGNAFGRVGFGFHDHLTMPAATLTGEARTRLLHEFRPWVFGPTLHSLKLEASAELRQRLSLNPIMAHLTLEEPVDSGLAVVRQLLLSRQDGHMGAALAANASKLPAAMVEAIRLAFSTRFLHRRSVSEETIVRLQMNAAQDAPSESRITLSEDLDAFGMPLPVVDWRISEHEVSTLRRFAGHLREQFSRLNIGSFEWVPELFAGEGPLRKVADARHSMGGACMGVDPRTSVVDPDLTVHGVENLSIASAATFPNGDAQLPTLPLMALALRLADRVATRVGSSVS